jgi:hypothetical protein
LFDDDFTSDNKVQFNGKFVGKTNVKFNVLASPRIVNNEVTYGLEEDVQLDLKVQDIGVQAKFKPSLVSVHADFGQHLKTCDKKGHVYNTWFNPYLIWETTRSLKVNNYIFGSLVHLNSSVKNHVA